MKCRLAAVAMLLFASAPARAVSCTVSSGGVAFGSYDPTSAIADDAIGTVTVGCTGLLGLFVSYSVQLSAGNSGNQLNRAMTSGSSQLHYNLYTDVTHTMIWGDGNGGTSIVSGNFVLVLVGNSALYTAYGRVPAQQAAAAGGYSDSLTLTISY